VTPRDDDPGRDPGVRLEALNEFVAAQRPFPFGIEAAVQTAEAAGADRIIAFRSADAVGR